jgi:hypothetical protein
MLPTEFEFVLPRGLLVGDLLHRRGVMRLATARDELSVQRNPRVRSEPEYSTLVMLSQVIVSLGSLEELEPELLEDLFSQDLAFLREFFNQINQNENLLLPTICPACRHQFEVELALAGE